MPSHLPPAPPASSTSVASVMRGNRSADTKPELALRRALHRRGLRYRVNTRASADVRCRADIVFRGAAVAVFVDGCFWHRCGEHGGSPRVNSTYWTAKLDRNVERDRAVDAALEDAGWLVIRVWEHEDPALAAARIAEAVRARAARRSQS